MTPTDPILINLRVACRSPDSPGMDGEEETPLRLSVKWEDTDTFYIDILVRGSAPERENSGVIRPGDTADRIGQRLREALWRAFGSRPGQIPDQHHDDIDVGWYGPPGTGETTAWIYIREATHIDFGAAGKIKTITYVGGGWTPDSPPPPGNNRGRSSGTTTPGKRRVQTPEVISPTGIYKIRGGGERPPEFNPSNTAEIEAELSGKRPLNPKKPYNRELKTRIEEIQLGKVPLSFMRPTPSFFAYMDKRYRRSPPLSPIGFIGLGLINISTLERLDARISFPVVYTTPEDQTRVIVERLLHAGVECAPTAAATILPLQTVDKKWLVEFYVVDLTQDSLLEYFPFPWTFELNHEETLQHRRSPSDTIVPATAYPRATIFPASKSNPTNIRAPFDDDAGA